MKPDQSFTHKGDLSLLDQPSLGLFCSASAPPGVLLALHDLAQGWRQNGPLLISGFQSPAEAEVFTVLLRGPRPVVQVLARGMYRRVPVHLCQALDAGRLLLLSPFEAGSKRITVETAYQRNQFVAALADELLIAYAHPSSKTEQIAAAWLAQGKPVWTVDHPVNQPLIQQGARPLES